jgi:ABC-type nickel/cobalt efflux system permease component RcnA
MPVAFALGALHAMEPGHGKSLASAYLVTGKHTWADAVVLGVATTLSHTAVVFLLAFGSLGLKDLLPPESLERLVALAGAWTLLGLGLWVCGRSIRDLRHGHSHGHSHAHGHGHSHGSQAHTGDEGLWGVALIGLSNGALPCPGAIAALLVALASGRVALGMTTVLVYSLGLAAALAAAGILVVEAGRRARAWLPSERAMLWMPLGSGLLVFSTGAWLLLKR